MNESIKKLIEERSLDDIATALELAVEVLEEISEHAIRNGTEDASTWASFKAYYALKDIQAIAEDNND